MRLYRLGMRLKGLGMKWEWGHEDWEWGHEDWVTRPGNLVCFNCPRNVIIDMSM